jgi:hypothetical protein
MKALPIGSLILSWIIWAYFFVTIIVISVAIFSQPGRPVTRSDYLLVALIGLACIVSWSVTFGVKWLLNWLAEKKTDLQARTLTTYIGLPLATLVIAFLLTATANFGLVVYFLGYGIMFYPIFAIPSLLILIFHNPYLLKPKSAPLAEPSL